VVTIITVGRNPEETYGASVREYLGWHRISANHRNVQPVAGAETGQQLLSAARNEVAELLVVGAFGHQRWREHLFGGAMCELVDISVLPLLLVH